VQSAPAPAPIPVAATVIAPPVEKKAEPADLVARHLAAGLKLIARPEPLFAVQLMVTDARGRDYLEGYLVEAAREIPPDRLFVAPSGSAEAPRLGVLVGPYPQQAEALAAVETLPQQLRQFRPYVRTFEALRDEARRAERR
jgi:septal ring-binding cell division protein DamX